MSSSSSSEPIASKLETLHSFVDAAELAGPPPLDRWNGKRSGPRRTLVVPVWVRTLPESVADPGRMCRLRDVTDWGVGLRSQVPYQLRQNVWIELRVNNATWSGAMQVVHCTQTIGGYTVGLVMAGFTDPKDRCDADSKAAPRPDATGDPTSQLRETLREREWLVQAKAEIREAIRAYHLARRSWGLLGTSIRREIRRVVSNLPGTVDTEKDTRRAHPRTQGAMDVQIVFCSHETWRRIPARLADASEGGVGLVLPYELIRDPAERERTGGFKAHAGMTIILGLGSEPNTLWVPAEIIHCQQPVGDLIRVGAQFLTSRSLAIFGEPSQTPT
jgi:hypothetical protein